ncbi:MAG: DUF4230 domain-containing protein [Myxococcota bacterium]|nr:DUF4230 domain-containing protein [Myxococcota bacterium]
MSEPASPDREPRAEMPRGIQVGARVLLALLAIAIGSAVATLVWRLAGGTDAPAETLSVRGGPDVVTAVRDLARLESAEYHMERVIELTSTQSRVWGLVEAEDSILLVAAADVVAGVDLAELADGAIVIDEEAGRARITLPPPRVLTTRLDNERTFVHSRRTDMLARRGQHLESQARREAERTLESSAIEAGILDRARGNAARTVESLVRSLGYEDVEVRFADDE